MIARDSHYPERIKKWQVTAEEDILIILNYRLTNRNVIDLWNGDITKQSEKTGNFSGMVEPIIEFTNTIVPGEHYFLYLLKYENNN